MSGRAIKVRTNYFEISVLPSFTKIYHYDIIILPDVPPALNRKIYQNLQRENSFGDVKPVFDGRRNIYAARPFPFGDVISFDITSFKVIIRKVAEINMEDLNKFLDENCPLSSHILTG
jgi:hypothetical protein